MGDTGYPITTSNFNLIAAKGLSFGNDFPLVLNDIGCPYNQAKGNTATGAAVKKTSNQLDVLVIADESGNYFNLLVVWLDCKVRWTSGENYVFSKKR